jgi:hypothetical protein
MFPEILGNEGVENTHDSSVAHTSDHDVARACDVQVFSRANVDTNRSCFIPRLLELGLEGNQGIGTLIGKNDRSIGVAIPGQQSDQTVVTAQIVDWLGWA